MKRQSNRVRQTGDNGVNSKGHILALLRLVTLDPRPHEATLMTLSNNTIYASTRNTPAPQHPYTGGIKILSTSLNSLATRPHGQ